MLHKLSLNDRAFDSIINGTKKIEIRSNTNDDYSNYKTGDMIQFYNSKEDVIMCKITEINYYKSVEELLTLEGTRYTTYSTNDYDEAVRNIKELNGYEEEIKKSGVYAIHIQQVCNNDLLLRELVEKFTKLNKTISTMESCTGGGVANSITNIEGASEILRFCAVTYSNEYKIKMGVSRDVIEKYSVYSFETAMEMSKNIANFANANYGIGITGLLNRIDSHNLTDKKNIVYISIYDRDNEIYINDCITVGDKTREENKNIIIEKVVSMLLDI